MTPIFKQDFNQSYLLQAGPSNDDDNEYPPLPDYSPESERANSDVYLVHAKGLPWACTADAVLQFFSGERRIQTNGVSCKPGVGYYISSLVLSFD